MKVKEKSGHAAWKAAALSCVFGAFSPMLMPVNAVQAQGGATPATPPPLPGAPATSPPAMGAPAAGVARPRRTTPAEREAARRARLEKTLRNALTRSGVADIATQDAVIAYARSEMPAREEAAATPRRVMRALRTGALTDAQLTALLGEMRDAAARERARRQRTATELDARIGYTKNPRLEAVLVLAGLVGDEASTLSPTLPPMPSAGRGQRAVTGGANNATRPRRPRRTNANVLAAPTPVPTTPTVMPAR